MNTKLYALIVVSIIVLGAGFYALFTIPGPNTITAHNVPEVGTTTMIKQDTDTYTIDVVYPHLGIPTIDSHIQSDIKQALDEFKNQEPNPRDSATPQNSFFGRFEDVYVGPDVVSMKLILSQYTGGAHPMTLFSGVNFDRATGKRLGLADALALIGKSVDDVSRESSTQFTKKFGADFFSDGATNNPENFSSFLIGKDSVTFIFQQYQVAAYVNGPQEVVFHRVK
jgi:hypothetical protein